MSKLKEVSATCAGTTLGIVLFLLSKAILWSAIILHLCTVCVLWQIHGIAIGIVGLLFPFVAEAYTFFLCWIKGGFLNYYTLAIGIVVGLNLLPFLIFYLVGLLYKENQDIQNRQSTEDD